MKLFLHLSSLVLVLSMAMVGAFILFFKVSANNQPLSPVSYQKILGTSTLLESQFAPAPVIDSTLKTADARPLIIKNYLNKYKSELEPYSQLIVDVSDKYSLDYRLLVAIAQQESNLCKRIPANSYNCWGFGIYGDKVTRFNSYPQALDKVAKTLKKEYDGLDDDTKKKILAGLASVAAVIATIKTAKKVKKSIKKKK